MTLPTINHEERQKSLHSTDVSAILGLDDRKNDHTVWLEKTGRLEPWTGNKSTDAGKVLEPSVLDWAERELGPIERNVVCVADGLDFPLAATLDGRVLATGNPVEAKTTGIVGPVYGTWGDDGSDVVPDLYLVQASVQMVCSAAELDHLCALIGGRGFVEYRILRDELVSREIIERCARWWDRHIVKGIEPTITEPIPLEIVKRMRRTPDKTIQLEDDATIAVAEYEAAKAVKSAAEKTCEVAQSKLLSLLGDAEAGRLEDGRLVTYFEQQRKGYTVLDTSYRVLRIKKA